MSVILFLEGSDEERDEDFVIKSKLESFGFVTDKDDEDDEDEAGVEMELPKLEELLKGLFASALAPAPDFAPVNEKPANGLLPAPERLLL